MSTTKSFASSADLGEKKKTLEILAEGVCALAPEGDPNIGAIEGEDFLVCFEALATPVMAAEWLEELRQHTDMPIRYLVLSHYHAVRVLGADSRALEKALQNTIAASGSEAARVLAEREVRPGPPRRRGPGAGDRAPGGRRRRLTAGP